MNMRVQRPCLILLAAGSTLAIASVNSAAPPNTSAQVTSTKSGATVKSTSTTKHEGGGGNQLFDAPAAPFLINISGSTAQQNFFTAPASTNDFLNVDAERGDTKYIMGGNYTNSGQLQLAQNGLPTTNGGAWPTFGSPAQISWWEVQYRGVGSGNGLTELATFGINPAVNAGDLDILSADAAFYNRTTQYINLGNPQGSFYNLFNPGAGPLRGNPGAFSFPPATRFSADPFHLPSGASSGATLIDIAAVDVPAQWFIAISGGSPSATHLPNTPGYGLNPTTTRNPNGTISAFANSFATLPPGVVTAEAATVNDDPAKIIYSTPTAWIPIATITNFGTGKQQATYVDLRHLFATGRMTTGENLVVAVRDVGSGTRNAYATSIGLDPSYCVGDNVGVKNTNNADSNLGTGQDGGAGPIGSFVPASKGGSGSLERTVTQCRLAIGHSGAERGNGSWLTTGTLEILAVLDDAGGTQFVRPYVDYVVHNGLIGQLDQQGNPLTHDGYRIGGTAVFSSLGDPRQTSAAKGGYGFTPPGTDTLPYPTTSAMRNSEAAAYLNNISRSIESFTSVGPDSAAFSPAEFLAKNFTLYSGVDRLPTATNPRNFSTLSTLFVQSAQDYSLASGKLANAAYLAFGNGSASAGTSLNGKVPIRSTRTAGTYSDGTIGNSGYRDTLGNTIASGSNFPTNRNRISGDFDGNSKRDWSDIPEMIKGYRFRYEAAAWTPNTGTGSIAGALGTSLSPEIIGDFDGNGSFDKDDVRYFADGLATAPVADATTQNGDLNRKKGFTDVDHNYFLQAGSHNFFGYPAVFTTGKAYAEGDARGDVWNHNNLLDLLSGHVTPGAAPTGYDMVINSYDIDYVYKQFKNRGLPGDDLDWKNNLAGAVGADLSCDMTGDLHINQADVDELVQVILGTDYGDVNLDGVINAADRSQLLAHYGMAGGWNDGDMNGDGVVDSLDLAIVDAHLCKSGLVTGTGCLGPVDLLSYLGLYFTNFDGNGSSVPGDNMTLPQVNPTSPLYAVPCTPAQQSATPPVITAAGLKADFDGDCQVGPVDLLSYLNDYFNPNSKCFSGCN